MTITSLYFRSAPTMVDLLAPSLLAPGLPYIPGVPLAPGLYDGIPHAEYLAIPAASASRLKLLKRSPAHMRAHILVPQKETEALIAGRAVHAAVLERERYESEYVVMPDFSKLPANKTEKGEPSTSSATKFVKMMTSEFERLHEGKTIIDTKLADLSNAIVASMQENTFCRTTLEAEGVYEQTVIWHDKETGVLCKARSDKRLTLNGVLVVADLKTTVDASQRGFERETWKYRYDIQAALYLDGLSHFIEADAAHFLFLAVEKEPPYACAAYRLDDASIEKGRETYQPLLARYAECEAAQCWPAYSNELEILSLPNYAFNEYEG